MNSTLFYILFLTVVTAILPATADARELARPILLGQSCALHGPTQNLGKEMRAGLLAAFAEQNSHNGIHGREIILISLDDGYEPYRAVRNTLELINDLDVFLLIGEVGTPTSKAVLPLINQYKIPFFAPLTGAEFLRTPFNRYVVNTRGSYYEEMERIAAYLVDQKQLTRVACFYQNDSYGFAGLQGIQQALMRRGLKLVARGSYERNTVAVLGGLKDINSSEPEAVVLVGAYPACVEFIKLSKLKKHTERLYCNISFTGSKSMKRALGDFGKGVIISQVVPFPWNRDLPLVQAYQNALATYQKDYTPGFGSLEGYIAGRLFCLIAEQVEGELTREKFLDTLYTIGTFDLGGLVLHFDKENNQGSTQIYLTEIQSDFVEIE